MALIPIDPGFLLPDEDDLFEDLWDLIRDSLLGDGGEGTLSGAALDGVRLRMREIILDSLDLPSDCDAEWPSSIPITYSDTPEDPTNLGASGFWRILMDLFNGGYANSWTVGRARVQCRGSADISKESSLLCCCKRKVSVSMSCSLVDTFDFEEHPWEDEDSVYNRWARWYQDVIGGESIAISAKWDDKWEDSSCLDWRFIPGM